MGYFGRCLEDSTEEIIRRLQKGDPVPYVLGDADFAGRPFPVEPGVLIPRPETAELCEWIKKDATDNKGITEGVKEENAIRILDICTGSGCIAITLGLTSAVRRLRVGIFRKMP